MLMDRGWPTSSLLMTVVRDEKGEGHAVLTARTAQGDFILDNKVDEVKLWHQTRYEFIMRQSYSTRASGCRSIPRECDARAALACAARCAADRLSGATATRPADSSAAAKPLPVAST